MKKRDDYLETKCINCGTKMQNIPAGSWISEYKCPKCLASLMRMHQDRMSGCMYDPIDTWRNPAGKEICNIEWAIQKYD